MTSPCPECLILRQRLAELEAQLQQLTQLLEQARRSGKRQAAPFAKGPAKSRPKRPGRKAGDQHGRHGHRLPPDGPIHECVQAPLPAQCPHCFGEVVPTHCDTQYQTELPRQPWRRRIDIHCGQCRQCRRPVRGHHPLQTSDATGAAASQVGPDAQAAVVVLNKQLGLSHAKIAAVFTHLLGIPLTRGASAQIVLRAGERLQPAYQEILSHLPQEPWLSVDETGWRVGGRSAWLHVWVGGQATAYAIDPHRDADRLEQVLGRDWSGVLVHDGWASYDRFEEAVH
jgi:transposase